jgi:seryl-tRNA synthetase
MNIALGKVAGGECDRLTAIAETLLRPTGAEGVHARTGAYEDIVERLAGLISRYREPQTEVLRFPPVMSRRDLERSGYLKSFPNLLGCVCTLQGTEVEIRAAAHQLDTGGDWTSELAAADLVLSPAACYPVYPLAARRNPAPLGGHRFDVASDCYRHEPSRDLDRLRSFRMREYVCIGSEREATEFRHAWVERAQDLAVALGLPHEFAQASDPFFGRTGQMMAASQLQQALKLELLVPVRSVEEPTACMSFNYHRDHFGMTWGLRDHAGDVAHTACVAFGMDRLALALFCTHGTEVANWPNRVREALQAT